VHENLAEGATVRVRGPRNHFALVDSPRYLFIAGGIGITPLMAMIESAQRTGSDWTLIYLGRSRKTMAFAGDLSASYGDRVRLWPNDEKGHFDLEAVLEDPADRTLVYCCGPERLLSAVEKQCGHWPEGSLHIERFAAKAPAEPAAESLDTFHVVCQRSGVTVEVSGETSILEALEDADIPIMSSCLEGICGTCTATVVEGTPDHRDSMLTEAERASGNKILTCVSRSCSEKLVLDL
jgi:ferredoxin-NADP reductase